MTGTAAAQRVCTLGCVLLNSTVAWWRRELGATFSGRPFTRSQLGTPLSSKEEKEKKLADSLQVLRTRAEPPPLQVQSIRIYTRAPSHAARFSSLGLASTLRRSFVCWIVGVWDCGTTCPFLSPTTFEGDHFMNTTAHMDTVFTFVFKSVNSSFVHERGTYNAGFR